MMDSGISVSTSLATLFILLDYLVHIDTIIIEMFILYFNG